MRIVNRKVFYDCLASLFNLTDQLRISNLCPRNQNMFIRKYLPKCCSKVLSIINFRHQFRIHSMCFQRARSSASNHRDPKVRKASHIHAMLPQCAPEHFYTGWTGKHDPLVFLDVKKHLRNSFVFHLRHNADCRRFQHLRPFFPQHSCQTAALLLRSCHHDLHSRQWSFIIPFQ